MNYTIHPDGSFDLFSHSLRIENCYPAIDGIPLRPVSISVNEDKVTYHLVTGTFGLIFRTSENLLSIEVSLDKCTAHDISYFHSAWVRHAVRSYGQGFGMSGPSEFHEIKNGDDFTSEAVIAIGNETSVICARYRDQSIYRNSFAMNGERISANVYPEGTYTIDRPLPALYLSEGTTFDEVLRSAALEIADEMHACPAEKPAFHWCSWYYLYHNLTQEILEEYLEGFVKYKEEFPFSHIQIDAGYMPSAGDWLLPSDRFPKGLKVAADTIKAAGYEPGIWIGPYMVGDNSVLYKEHPDWMLYYNDGTPVRPWLQYNEPKVWGYVDCDYFVLDVSHPDAMAYITNVFKTLHSWGYTLFKTDFLLWGIQDSSEVKRYCPGKTSFEYFRDLMTNIKKAIGDSAWLGCIAPFMPCVGFVNMMRLAADVGAQWEDDGFGPANMTNEIMSDHYFNNIYWQNDPDAVMIRDFHIHLSEDQVQALALLAAACGTAIYTSDPIHEVKEERRTLLRFIRPDGLQNPTFPNWGKNTKTALVVNQLPQGSVVLWFNPGKDEVIEPVDWSALVREGETKIREYRGGVSSVSELPYVRVPGKSARLFFVTKEELSEEPKNIWKW